MSNLRTLRKTPFGTIESLLAVVPPTFSSSALLFAPSRSSGWSALVVRFYRGDSCRYKGFSRERPRDDRGTFLRLDRLYLISSNAAPVAIWLTKLFYKFKFSGAAIFVASVTSGSTVFDWAALIRENFLNFCFRLLFDLADSRWLFLVCLDIIFLSVIFL